MQRSIIFLILGYLSGSVLYAQVFAGLFKKEKILENSKDQNPGTANAFLYGGFWCGLFTLLGDLLKGFLPVFFYLYGKEPRHSDAFLDALVIAAPVIGHAFPLFYGFKGGKGIAATFGCLAGLFPLWQPLAALAVFFIFFSVVLRVTPHFHRTLTAYLCTLVSIFCMKSVEEIRMAFLVITVTVSARMLASKEQKEKMEVSLLWRH